MSLYDPVIPKPLTLKLYDPFAFHVGTKKPSWTLFALSVQKVVRIVLDTNSCFLIIFSYLFLISSNKIFSNKLPFLLFNEELLRARTFFLTYSVFAFSCCFFCLSQRGNWRKNSAAINNALPGFKRTDSRIYISENLEFCTQTIFVRFSSEQNLLKRIQFI